MRQKLCGVVAVASPAGGNMDNAAAAEMGRKRERRKSSTPLAVAAPSADRRSADAAATVVVTGGAADGIARWLIEVTEAAAATTESRPRTSPRTEDLVEVVVGKCYVLVWSGQTRRDATLACGQFRV